MTDEIDWGAILRAQSGEKTGNEREESLITSCNESTDGLVSHEIFTLRKEKEEE